MSENSNERYNKKKWSRADLDTIIRNECRRFIHDKRREMYSDVGVLRLDGDVTFRQSEDKSVEAIVDYTSVSEFIYRHFSKGDKVAVIVMDGDRLGDKRE